MAGDAGRDAAGRKVDADLASQIAGLLWSEKFRTQVGVAVERAAARWRSSRNWCCWPARFRRTPRAPPWPSCCANAGTTGQKPWRRPGLTRPDDHRPRAAGAGEDVAAERHQGGGRTPGVPPRAPASRPSAPASGGKAAEAAQTGPEERAGRTGLDDRLVEAGRRLVQAVPAAALAKEKAAAESGNPAERRRAQAARRLHAGQRRQGDRGVPSPLARRGARRNVGPEAQPAGNPLSPRRGNQQTEEGDRLLRPAGAGQDVRRPDRSTRPLGSTACGWCRRPAAGGRSTCCSPGPTTQPATSRKDDVETDLIVEVLTIEIKDPVSRE